MFPVPGKLNVKICGLTSAEQALAVAQMGADALGLNFWEKSKRYVPPTVAAGWTAILRPLTTLVAVMVNPSTSLLEEIVGLNVVDVLQLHGDETPEETHHVMTFGLPVIKALQVRDRSSLSQIGDYPATTILLDAYNPGLYGGEGKSFPWDLAIEAQERFPEKTFILAGGLTPENVGLAVAQVQPAGVDVASGVEKAPGIKDLSMVRRFIEGARNGAAKGTV